MPTDYIKLLHNRTNRPIKAVEIYEYDNSMSSSAADSIQRFQIKKLQFRKTEQ